MGDLLKYSLPFEKVIVKNGAFKKAKFSELSDGFVLSNFDKSEAFIFEEGGTSIGRSDLQKPLCYSEAVYLEKGERFIQEIRNNELSKVIFSRVKSHQSSKGVDAVFEELNKAYPSAFVYLISSRLFGTWIGATPETLISCNQEKGETVALAGTMKSTDTSFWSEKEKIEQQFVSDFIEDQLTALSVHALVKDGPKDRIAGPVKHIETRFQFSLNGQKPIQIADKLHPTPAVSGLPQKEAIELIDSIEEHKRSLYAGCIGVLGDRADLFVNLRCAQLIENEYFLYLGGGFTKDSIAKKEWQETENKSRTLLDILENS
ncbi:MAG: chorismate-binding protein [Crocinitomicaceae bacterium]|nr:chorismate-binding protein [Flavobacteriales bacterium]NQZ37525.1 chorismate-binding protein [Crocinitomicaceae bacterium]